MKIVFLNFYSGYIYRGGETYVHELGGQLAKNNQVFVFQAGPINGSENYKVVTIGVPMPKAWPHGLSVTHPLKRLFLDYYKLKELVFTLKSLSRMAKIKPDVIIPLNGGWQALITSIYCRLSGAKLIIAGQSGPGWDDRWNLLVKPSLFVALTTRQLNWAKKATIWKQDFALIPNGVDLEKFTAAPLRTRLRTGEAGKKFHADLEKPIIMLVAASTPDKRVEQGIRAVAKLPAGSLLLLGTGPLDERINKLGYELLGEKRFFHTSVNHDSMPEYYRAADLFTLCSYSSEAFGIVYLEAMASGLPCVATDDESRREIVGNAGVFVKDPDDAKEYATALKQSLEKNWKDLPRKQAEKFSWDNVADEYEKVL